MPYMDNANADRLVNTEYVFLPPSAEENGLSSEMQERLDNDPHFYVSIG